MIYTSYFAKIKTLPEGVIPISICGKAPSGYKRLLAMAGNFKGVDYLPSVCLVCYENPAISATGIW